MGTGHHTPHDFVHAGCSETPVWIVPVDVSDFSLVAIPALRACKIENCSEIRLLHITGLKDIFVM